MARAVEQLREVNRQNTQPAPSTTNTPNLNPENNDAKTSTGCYPELGGLDRDGSDSTCQRVSQSTRESVRQPVGQAVKVVGGGGEGVGKVARGEGVGEVARTTKIYKLNPTQIPDESKTNPCRTKDNVWIVTPTQTPDESHTNPCPSMDKVWIMTPHPQS